MDVGQSQHELYNGYEYCSPSPSPSGLHHSRLMSLPLPLLLPLLRPNPPPSVGEGSTRQDQVEENKVTLLLPGLHHYCPLPCRWLACILADSS